MRKKGNQIQGKIGTGKDKTSGNEFTNQDTNHDNQTDQKREQIKNGSDHAEPITRASIKTIDKRIDQATQLILSAKKIQTEILKHSRTSCTSCGERSIKYAQARLDKVNINLAGCGSRAIRIANRRLSNTFAE